MESQRSLLLITLAFLGFLIWQAWIQDHAPAPAQPASPTTTQQPAVPAAQTGNAEDLPSVAATPATESQIPSQRAANATLPAGQLIHVVTDVLDLKISTRGGDLVDVKLPTYPVSLERKDEPFQLLHLDPPPYIAQSGLLAGDRSRAPTHHAEFVAGQTEYRLADGNEQLIVPLVWVGKDGIRVTKTYTFTRGKFYVDVDYKIENQSGTDLVAAAYMQLRHGPAEVQQGMFGARSFNGAAYYDGEAYHKLPFDEMEEEPLDLTVKSGWVAILQHYFISAWLPQSAESENQLYSKAIRNGGLPAYLIGIRTPPLTVAAGQSGSIGGRVYVGPKLQKELAKLYPGLELTSDYGIFTIFAKPLFWMLDKIHAVVGNWGWAIIILTLLIKLAFYKLSETSYRSMAKMKKVAPKLQAIKERYPDDKQRQQQAMMELYKTEKINPLGGCLPILIQIPVFIALFWVLQESVELRQAPWILWIKDLSLKDPYYILPLLMGASMYLQNKLNPPQPDPMMQKVMMTMPIVFTFFFAFFPSGLVLYWVVNNILSIAQQWYITRQIEQEASKARS